MKRRLATALIPGRVPRENRRRACLFLEGSEHRPTPAPVSIHTATIFSSLASPGFSSTLFASFSLFSCGLFFHPLYAFSLPLSAGSPLSLSLPPSFNFIFGLGSPERYRATSSCLPPPRHLLGLSSARERCRQPGKFILPLKCCETENSDQRRLGSFRLRFQALLPHPRPLLYPGLPPALFCPSLLVSFSFSPFARHRLFFLLLFFCLLSPFLFS